MNKKVLRHLYYLVKPIMPRSVQLFLRRRRAAWKLAGLGENIWPIDRNADQPPAGWRGWPGGRQFALVLTHDVEDWRGVQKCRLLAELERSLNHRSSFNFVAEKYKVPPELRRDLARDGFEIGVHELLHDGKLYQSRRIFLERAGRINNYMKEWQAVGFRSPSMHHNLAWLFDLDIEYAASTFDTDPFEPQSDGIGTIFPLHLVYRENGRQYVELPYTLAQDMTLFVCLKEKSIRIWKEKLAWIAERGGMALLDTHPDYMKFHSGNGRKIDEYPADMYRELLEHINSTYGESCWRALPREVAHFVRVESGIGLTPIEKEEIAIKIPPIAQPAMK